MSIHRVLVLFGLLLASSPLLAADLAKVPRTIKKEPAYRGKPRYALLVFGHDAKSRMWFVQDDQSLFIDRNGNDDLTEHSERFGSSNGSSFYALRFPANGHDSHLELFTHPDGTFTMTIGLQKRKQHVGVDLMARPSWGSSPKNAPIVHLDGPKELAMYGPPKIIPRMTTPSGQRRFSLRLMVGTSGLGKGTFASYDEVCTEDLGRLRADIVYLQEFPFGLPITQRIELLHDG
jgi:hypothetical protein